MSNINNIIDAHYNELEINDFDFYNDFNNNFNNSCFAITRKYLFN